jgi:light-regulated signal transduction histidine kinase (bacteriophytochrome)
LRAIDGFSRILLKTHAAALPGDAQHYLQVVRENAQQMGQLIDDLLHFARLGRQPLKKQPVATAELVQQVIATAKGECSERDVDIEVGELPVCEADPALLRQVFTNLIDNALKYTRQRQKAHIEIGSRPDPEHPGEAVYFVKDNGVGFDMRYVDKLFGVFQRLHRAEEYEGTGVGLATVQRIIHRHGGRIWADAVVDGGATFSFTLGNGVCHEQRAA